MMSPQTSLRQPRGQVIWIQSLFEFCDAAVQLRSLDDLGTAGENIHYLAPSSRRDLAAPDGLRHSLRDVPVPLIGTQPFDRLLGGTYDK
jgi:hypothetical protein